MRCIARFCTICTTCIRVENNYGGMLFLVTLQALACKPATSLKIILLYRCFSRFWNCTNATKLRKEHIFYLVWLQVPLLLWSNVRDKSVSFKTGIINIGQYFKTFSSIIKQNFKTENQNHKSYHRFYDGMKVHRFISSTWKCWWGVETFVKVTLWCKMTIVNTIYSFSWNM